MHDVYVFFGITLERNHVHFGITVGIGVVIFIWSMREGLAELRRPGGGDPTYVIPEILRNGGRYGLETLMLNNWDTRALSVSHSGVYAELRSYNLIPLSRYTKEVIWNSVRG